MGRELQKKKNRSSNPRIRQKPKSKKKILANPIIAANWNQKETLTQNYRRLGLVSNLNKRTGGTDKTPLPNAPSHDSTALLVNGPGTTPLNPKTLAPDEVRVTRDPKTGAILSVDSAEAAANPLNDPLNSIDDDDYADEWSPHEFAHVPAVSGGESSVVKMLQEEARMGGRKRKRTQSAREQEWICDLVARYGEDYGRMSRDRKMNPNQQTAADLKRRVEKWRKGAEGV